MAHPGPSGIHGWLGWATRVPLVDDPGRDAGVLQPGREGVAEVVGAIQIHGRRQRVTGRGQRPPPLLTVLTSAGDQLGRGEFGLAHGMAPLVVLQPGGGRWLVVLERKGGDGAQPVNGWAREQGDRPAEPLGQAEQQPQGLLPQPDPHA